jgi:hypothetical protein
MARRFVVVLRLSHRTRQVLLQKGFVLSMSRAGCDVVRFFLETGRVPSLVGFEIRDMLFLWKSLCL